MPNIKSYIIQPKIVNSQSGYPQNSKNKSKFQCQIVARTQKGTKRYKIHKRIKKNKKTHKPFEKKNGIKTVP
jgi:hypothetical protein